MSHPRMLVFALLIASLPACKGAEPNQGAGAEKAPAKAELVEVEPVSAETAGSASSQTGEGPGSETEEAAETGDDTDEQAPVPESFEEVGVEVCDQYVKDYVACIEAKVPEAQREAQRRIVFENVAAWKQTAAGGPSAAKGLQTGCRIAREQAKRVTRDWACEW